MFGMAGGCCIIQQSLLTHVFLLVFLIVEVCVLSKRARLTLDHPVDFTAWRAADAQVTFSANAFTTLVGVRVSGPLHRDA